jgi:hypothetical protein
MAKSKNGQFCRLPAFLRAHLPSKQQMAFLYNTWKPFICVAQRLGTDNENLQEVIRQSFYCSRRHTKYSNNESLISKPLVSSSFSISKQT